MTMKNLIRLTSLTLSVVVGLSTGPAMAGKLYKWVDENGRVRYGDSIPPQYARKSNQTLNEQGVVVERKAAAKTPEQIAEEARIKAEQEEAERIRKEKAYQDRILLDTFTNEDEMVMTRDGKIEAIEAVIRVTKGRNEKLEQRLTELKQHAAYLERSGRPVPESLNKEITESRDQIAENLKYVKNRKQEQQNIRDKFEQDIRRFRELKTAAASEEK
jgi:hypothetical protein